MVGADTSATDDDANHVTDSDSRAVLPAADATHSVTTTSLGGDVHRERGGTRSHRRYRRSIRRQLWRLRRFRGHCRDLKFLL